MKQYRQGISETLWQKGRTVSSNSSHTNMLTFGSIPLRKAWTFLFPNYKLDSTTTLLWQEKLWHWITHEGWYAIKQRQETKPNHWHYIVSFKLLVIHRNTWNNMSLYQQIIIIIIIIIIDSFSSFFKPTLANGFSLEFEWQQVSSVSPGLVSGFWPFLSMQSFGYSLPLRQFPSLPSLLIIL